MSFNTEPKLLKALYTTYGRQYIDSWLRSIQKMLHTNRDGTLQFVYEQFIKYTGSVRAGLYNQNAIDEYVTNIPPDIVDTPEELEHHLIEQFEVDRSRFANFELLDQIKLDAYKLFN